MCQFDRLKKIDNYTNYYDLTGNNSYYILAAYGLANASMFKV